MFYAKTLLGQQAFKDRAPQLTSRLRIAYLMIDGVRSRADVLAATIGMGVLESDLEQLERLAFIAPVAVAKDAMVTERRAALSADQQAVLYIEATHRATAMTAKLGLRGFKLNLAVESARNLDDLQALLPDLRAALGDDVVAPLARLIKHD
jgi:hypothetical protein